MSEEKDINNIKKGKEAYSKGKAYEDFIENFYKRIKGIFHKIEKRKIIDGKTTRCGFDLYWEEEKEYEGIAKVAIECKFLSKEVPVKEMRDFVGKIKDCGINKGIFITTKGFQKGCIEIAEKENIETFIIRKPVEKDWEGLIKELNFEFNIFYPIYRDIKIKANIKEIHNNKAIGINEDIEISQEELFIIDKKDGKRYDILKLTEKLVNEHNGNNKNRVENKVYTIKKDFDNACLEKNKKEVKIESINIEYKYLGTKIIKTQSKIDFSKHVLAFFKNLRKENDKGELITDPYSFKH